MGDKNRAKFLMFAKIRINAIVSIDIDYTAEYGMSRGGRNATFKDLFSIGSKIIY